MKHTRTPVITRKIHAEEYVNVNTGEFLDSEQGNNIQAKQISMDKVILDYKSYVTISSDAMSFLLENMTPTDVGNIHSMITMIKDGSNILFKDEETHHNDESLSKHFNYAKTNFYSFINKMVSNGVLYQLKGKFNDRVEKKYILNPYLARRKKLIDTKSLKYFTPFNPK